MCVRDDARSETNGLIVETSTLVTIKEQNYITSNMTTNSVTD